MWVALRARICLLWHKDWFYDARRVYNRTFYKQSSASGCLCCLCADGSADLPTDLRNINLRQKQDSFPPSFTFWLLIHQILSGSGDWYSKEISLFHFSLSFVADRCLKSILLWMEQKRRRRRSWHWVEDEEIKDGGRRGEMMADGSGRLHSI